VRERIVLLAEKVRIRVLTADTHGRAGQELEGVSCLVHFPASDDHTREKRRRVEQYGAERVFAVANGNNDVGLLHAARIGVAVCLAEGGSGEAAKAADIPARSPLHALDLLLAPQRPIATLRR
jgi:soluble P-type ATPase